VGNVLESNSVLGCSESDHIIVIRVQDVLNFPLPTAQRSTHLLVFMINRTTQRTVDDLLLIGTNIMKQKIYY
jgi:hypothetical protein